MPNEEFFPVELERKPSCQLTEQWNRTDAGVKTLRYVGADGYVYESKKPGDGKLVWKRVGRNG